MFQGSEIRYMLTAFYFEDLKGWHHLEDLDMDGTVTLRRVLSIYGVTIWTGLFSSRYDPVAGFSEHGNETQCSIKGKEFIKDSASRREVSIYRTFVVIIKPGLNRSSTNLYDEFHPT